VTKIPDIKREEKMVKKILFEVPGQKVMVCVGLWHLDAIEKYLEIIDNEAV